MFRGSMIRTRVLIITIPILWLVAGFAFAATFDLTVQLKTIGEEREKSVGYAKIARVTFKKQQKKLTQAMLYYTDAKSIGNPMIQHLQTSLTNRSMKESQVREMISEDVKRLVQVNEKFRAFIETGETSNRALPGLAAVAGTAGPITDACMNLWKEYKDADKKKVDNMVQVLDGYKWRTGKSCNFASDHSSTVPRRECRSCALHTDPLS